MLQDLPANIYSSKKQYNRYAEGESFQEQVRRSWKLIPCWRRGLRDGGGLENPADSVVLTESKNLLVELKSTSGNKFSLSMLRECQVTGLITFEKILKRNEGFIFINFTAYQECYAFRLVNAVVWMRDNSRKSVPIDVLRDCGFNSVVSLPTIDIGGEMGFDLRGVL